MLERWNRAIEAVEDGLGEPIEVAALARIALTSEYHFRRVFSSLAGMPISEYVRRRRMTLAAAEVIDGAPLADVAVRYGYTSADSFRRAFVAVHGVGPSDARRRGAVLRSQPRLRFHLIVEGTNTMHHRITELGAFHAVGRSARMPLVHRGPNEALIAFHRSLPPDLAERLGAVADRPEPTGPFSLSTGFATDRADGSEFQYLYGVAATHPPQEDEYDALAVPAHLWVVFEIQAESGFAEAMQQAWAFAYGDWFPSNPYRTVEGPEILTVLESSDDGESGRAELWLPVERDPSPRHA